MRSAPTLKIWMTPLASVAMLEKLALLKIALCRAPVVSSASALRASTLASAASRWLLGRVGMLCGSRWMPSAVYFPRIASKLHVRQSSRHASLTMVGNFLYEISTEARVCDSAVQSVLRASGAPALPAQGPSSGGKLVV